RVLNQFADITFTIDGGTIDNPVVPRQKNRSAGEVTEGPADSNGLPGTKLGQGLADKRVQGLAGMVKGVIRRDDQLRATHAVGIPGAKALVRSYGRFFVTLNDEMVVE